jgi:hypothetical protein
MHEKMTGKEILVPGAYGLKSDIVFNSHKLFFCKSSDIKKVLISELLPFYETKLKAKYISPLKVNARYQQSFMSLVKFLLIYNEFGLEKSKELILEKRVLENLLPDPTKILSFVESLLTFSPFAVSLPVHRIGSQLNLLCDSLWVFEYVAAQGMYEILLTEKSPLMELENKRMFSLGEVSSFTSRKYYMASINAVNNYDILQ